MDLSFPTISDFIANCWRRAKAEISQVDPKFVSTLETEARLGNVGLIVPWPTNLKSRPKLQLPNKWHQLLESCLELEIQANCLVTAASLLGPTRDTQGNLGFVGQAAIHNWRSWYFHALALAERTESVIVKTLQVATKASPGLNRKFRNRVAEELTVNINRQRQDCAHGFRRSWAAGLTEDHLWERAVVIGLTPEVILNKFFYVEEGKRVKDGKYSYLEDITQEFLAIVGAILHDLEVEAGLSSDC